MRGLTERRRGGYAPPAPANLRDWKHSRQKTGRPCVGRNGTVVSLPQAEQFVLVSTRSRPMPLPPEGRAARFALQLLQRFGSFLKFLSAKNNCSPAVQMKGAPQSTQSRLLSWNSIATSFTRPCYPATLAGCRAPAWSSGPGPNVLNPIRGAASCAYVYARAPAWRGGDLQASDRRSAS